MDENATHTPTSRQTTIPTGPILIGIGANLPSPRFGSPCQTCEAALAALAAAGVRIRACSPWYEAAPVPISDQPWYINGVVEAETDLAPDELLALLHRIEREFGRNRRVRNEARVIDLDLLAYGALVRPSEAGQEGPDLPHPRLAERGFVLLPLRDLRPGWRHPVSGRSVDDLIDALPTDQTVRRLVLKES